MATSFSVSKLKELSPHTFRLSARNDAGDGPFSDPKTFYTKAQPPQIVKGESIIKPITFFQMMEILVAIPLISIIPMLSSVMVIIEITFLSRSFSDLEFKKLSLSSGKLSWHCSNTIRPTDVINYVVQKQSPDQSKEFIEVFLLPHTISYCHSFAICFRSSFFFSHRLNANCKHCKMDRGCAEFAGSTLLHLRSQYVTFPLFQEWFRIRVEVSLKHPRTAKCLLVDEK